VTLLALASYWPVIRPTLETLARDTGLQRKTVVAYLSELVELDVVTTKYEGRTAYRMLNLDHLVQLAHQRLLRVELDRRAGRVGTPGALLSGAGSRAAPRCDVRCDSNATTYQASSV
jgi:hypothetical protein